MITRLTTVLLLGIGPTSLGRAEPNTAAPPPATAAESAAPAAANPRAVELARLVVPRDDWSRAIDMLSQDAQSRMQGHPGSKLEFPADFGARVRGEVQKILPYDDLIAMHARELSARYADGELSELLAFYKTPVGQKSLKELPLVAEKVGQQSQQRFEQKMPDVMKRLAKELKQPAPAAKAKPAAKAGK